MAIKPLSAQQKQQLKKATAAGNQQQYLTNHPGVQQHITKLQGGNPQQQQHATTLLGGAPAPAAPAPPQGSGATGANNNLGWTAHYTHFLAPEPQDTGSANDAAYK